MKNIFLIPTDNPSRLVLDIVNKNLFLTTTKDFETEIMQFQNIYITSDEEIKDGEHHISSDGWCIDKTSKEDLEVVNEKRNGYKKIILTTDQDLIKDGVQAIPDEFLEWFVKNPSCEKVEVVIMNEGYDKSEDVPYQECYKIIIPKEEPKQETLEEASIRAIKSGLFKDETLFIAGVKWQKERMYSEEDLEVAYFEGREGLYSFTEWFNQFKKK